MRSNVQAAGLFLLAAGAGCAMAAGGHHAMDDAAILEEGRCKVEGWFERSGAPARLLHVGVGCRVGPVEVVASSEYERQRGSGPGSQTGHALQAKWATEIAGGFSAGWSVAPQWQARARPRWQATTGIALLMWEATEAVTFHGNIGRDFIRNDADQDRGGLGVDWEFRQGWKLMAERYRQDAGHFARAGLRWEPARDWTVDVSRARRLRGAGDSSWTLGLTREFDR